MRYEHNWRLPNNTSRIRNGDVISRPAIHFTIYTGRNKKYGNKKKFTCKKCIKTRQHQVAIVIYKSVIYIGLVNLCSKCIPPLLNLDSPLESLAMSRFSSVLLKLPSLPTHCQACLNRFANITHYVPS